MNTSVTMLFLATIAAVLATPMVFEAHLECQSLISPRPDVASPGVPAGTWILSFLTQGFMAVVNSLGQVRQTKTPPCPRSESISVTGIGDQHERADLDSPHIRSAA